MGKCQLPGASAFLSVAPRGDDEVGLAGREAVQGERAMVVPTSRSPSRKQSRLPPDQSRNGSWEGKEEGRRAKSLSLLRSGLRAK